MPGRRKKNFKTFRNVAKEGASFFEVGYRSQRDPMLADSEASEHVLVPKSAKEQQLEEQHKYGIYFDDEYDYLQHLKDVNELPQRNLQELPSFQMKDEEEDVRSVSAASSSEPRLMLPGSALGSAVERGVGMLNMAAPSPGPKLDWDPDIVAALDDDFDFDDPDNELEDDFMQMANAEKSVLSDKLREADGQEEGGSEDESLTGDFNDSMQLSDDDEWTDEDDSENEDDGMTNFSRMSSAVLPRNDKLRLLDDQTEALMKREYSEDQIGALDCEELDGRVNFQSDLFLQCLKDFESTDKAVTFKDLVDSKDKVRPVLPESWHYVEDEDHTVEDSDKDPRDQEPLYTPKKPQFDCQSIISTYSRGKNLPTVIQLPEDPNKKKKKKKPEAPSDTVSDSTVPGLTLKELEQQMRAERLADAPSTYRPRGETTEEKRERKKAVKDHKKERRMEKKTNKLAFSSEMKQQNKVAQVSEAQKRVISFQS